MKFIHFLTIVLTLFAYSEKVFSIDLKTVLPDSIKFDRMNEELETDNKQKPYFYLNFGTGYAVNKMFGGHFLTSWKLGVEKSGNLLDLVYERRYGNSDSYYQNISNDTLKSINNYDPRYFGLEYQRQIYRNASHFLYSVVGAGTEWIVTKKSELFTERERIHGFAYNLGIGYAFFIKKKHGPNFEFLYHHAAIKNNGGTAIDPNSFIIRFTYNFGNNFQPDGCE